MRFLFIYHVSVAKSQTNIISFTANLFFSKKRPSWLFTSFFNSDKESYLLIHKSLCSLKMYSNVRAQMYIYMETILTFARTATAVSNLIFLNIATIETCV